MLSVNDNGGEVGIVDAFQTDEFYGTVLAAGIGNLEDFKEFLQKKEISLNENQLIHIFLQIYDNFTFYTGIGWAHRDIKPAQPESS